MGVVKRYGQMGVGEKIFFWKLSQILEQLDFAKA